MKKRVSPTPQTRTLLHSYNTKIIFHANAGLLAFLCAAIGRTRDLQKEARDVGPKR